MSETISIYNLHRLNQWSLNKRAGYLLFECYLNVVQFFTTQVFMSGMLRSACEPFYILKAVINV